MKIKLKLLHELIASVPLELQEQFHRHQLNTSTHRLKIFCGVLIVARIVHVLIVFPYSSTKTLFDFFREKIHNPFYVISFVLLFYLTVTYFSKKDRSSVVWFLCHLFVIFNLVLSVSHMFYFGENIHLIFFWFIVLFTLIPNFSPKVFITLSILYFIAAVAAMKYKNPVITFGYGDPESLVIEYFFAIIIIKILLYSSEVKTFVNTFRINVLNENLQELSVTDELTKIDNRRSFLNYMDIVWKQCQRIKLPLSIMMIDVDYFKKYNNSLGHLEGDKTLIAIAQCLKNNIKRKTDIVARFGGEEFVCLLPFIEKDIVLGFAKSLIQSVENLNIPHPMSECSKYVTISAGISTIIPDDNNSQTELLEEADKALYMAKKSGKESGFVKFFSGGLMWKSNNDG